MLYVIEMSKKAWNIKCTFKRVRTMIGKQRGSNYYLSCRQILLSGLCLNTLYYQLVPLFYCFMLYASMYQIHTCWIATAFIRRISCGNPSCLWMESLSLISSPCLYIPESNLAETTRGLSEKINSFCKMTFDLGGISLGSCSKIRKLIWTIFRRLGNSSGDVLAKSCTS